MPATAWVGSFTRIGQEVQVQFIAGDIDSPIIIGALYNGQGESGRMGQLAIA